RAVLYCSGRDNLAGYSRDCLVLFFQAEDGIRDWSVTGVQTCALPIWTSTAATIGSKPSLSSFISWLPTASRSGAASGTLPRRRRSEERRVGKERRCRGAPDLREKKTR